MAKCLKCGAGPEWLEGKIPNEPKKAKEKLADLKDAALGAVEAFEGRDRPGWSPTNLKTAIIRLKEVIED